MTEHDQARVEELYRLLDIRIDELESTQRMVYSAFLAYVDADMASTWLPAARELAEALRDEVNRLKRTPCVSAGPA